ncbi:hypothetical protein WM016_04775 [Bifidobacterium mongoliense]|uniref:hypothetical protein n=1 Tax=Bifidobacterium mongoliense TaxID=518643 RepID=UPI0030EC3B49
MSEPTTTDPTSTPTEPGAHPALPEDTTPGTPSGTEPDRHEEEQEPRNRRHDPAADAAKYRHKLRDAEAERDQLAAIAKTASANVYTQAVGSVSSHGARLAHPDDLERFTGKGPDSYVHDGQLDHDALQADLDSLRERRPELFREINYSPRPDPSQGHSGARGEGPVAWREAFSR